jgi:hypothetical protein
VNFALAKAALAFALVPLWSPPVRRRVEAYLPRCGWAGAVGVFALSRLVPCALAFLVLGLNAPGDSVEWGGIVEGRLPSPYSPGFDSLLAGIWAVTGTPLGFVFAMVIAETAAFGVYWKTTSLEADALHRTLSAFWLVNPLSLFHVSLGGQDEALILLVSCGVLGLSVRGRFQWAGLAGAVGVLLSKALASFVCLPLFAWPGRRPARGLTVFVVTLGVMAGALFVSGVTSGFLDELRYLTSGNVWVIPELLFGVARPVSALLACGVAAVAMAGCVVYIGRHPLADPLAQALRLTGTIGVTFLLLSPKSPTAWLVMFLPGVLFLLQTLDGWRVPFFLALFLPVAAFEPSLWFHLGQGALLATMPWERLAMIVADGVLLTGYVLIAFGGLRLRDGHGPSTHV